MGTRFLSALLLPGVLLRPCSAGSAAYAWHVHEYEFNFFEDLLVIVFVFLALSFEILWHGLGKGAEHSYRYGKYQEQATHHPENGKKDHANPIHPQLYNELYHRMGGEFMTLGILAFMIFAFNQLGGFNRLAGMMVPCGERCFHHPITEEQWLHLAELVHVKLFVGMLLYYVLIFYVVRGSVKQIQQWEKLRMRRIHTAAPGVPSEVRALDRDLEKHIQWREHFIEHVLRMRRCRPDTFRQVQRSVAARACETEHPSVTARGSFDSTMSADVESKLRQRFDQKFSLSAYLAVNLEHAVLDSIEVHKPTWAVLLCLFGTFSLLHYAAHLALESLVPAIIGVAFIILIVMWYLSKESQSMIKRHIRRSQLPNDKATQCLEDGRASSSVSTDVSLDLHSNPDTPLDKAKKVSIHERFNTETVVLRALQVFLFLISYVFSQTLLDANDWKANTRVTLLNTLGFTVLFLVMARFLPDMVPVFISVMAFPPHVDEANLAAFFSVLYEEEKRLAEDEQRNQAEHAEQSRRQEASDDVSGVEIESNSSLQAIGPPHFEAVRELAELLGVGEQLDKRLSERSPRPRDRHHPL